MFLRTETQCLVKHTLTRTNPEESVRQEARAGPSLAASRQRGGGAEAARGGDLAPRPPAGALCGSRACRTFLSLLTCLWSETRLHLAFSEAKTSM